MTGRPALSVTLTLSVTALLVTTGCFGVLVPDTPPSVTNGEGDTLAGRSSSGRNLTVEIVEAEATWSPGKVEVTARVNGTLLDDGEPLEGRIVGGVVNVTASECFGACQHGPLDKAKSVLVAYEDRTGDEGEFSAWVGPVSFNASRAPPVLKPYCDDVNLWTWGIDGWTADANARDTDEVWWEICTQSYP